MGAKKLTKGLIELIQISRWRPELNVFLFVSLIALGNLVLFQKPLLEFGLSVSSLPDTSGWMQILSLQVLQFGLLASVLFVVSVFSITAVKLLGSILAVINAIALYFMLIYNMEIDRSMIGNILNTDARESSRLLHISIVPYLLAFGVLPTLLMWWVKVRPSKWIWRLNASVLTFAAMLAFLFQASSTWLWYDQHASRLGSKILPWSYIVNTARHFNRIALTDRDQILLPDAEFRPLAPARKEVVVLVIGEAARAANFALYGYDKDTNPFTHDTTLTALPVGLSCSTNTISSTACILTHQGREAGSHSAFEPLPSYLTRHGVETIYRTNNPGPPPVQVTTYETAAEILQRCEMDTCPAPGFDEVLNWELGNVLNASSSDRIFVVLHQTGSHGPAYYSKYPEGFAQFTPECPTVLVDNCSQDELFNSYDNTIRYTDFLLNDLITQLDTVDAYVAMMYVSDHGQSLGEGGFYLHGAPNAVAPAEQREIPFLVWMSQGFKDSRGLSEADIIPAETFPHDFPFHSVMGFFGMRSDIYKPQYDIFNLDQ